MIERLVEAVKRRWRQDKLAPLEVAAPGPSDRIDKPEIAIQARKRPIKMLVAIECKLTQDHPLPKLSGTEG